ncbi:MAG: hypothetical protein EXQ95_09400 [Alphaproteobacteria bacterium]|nr:hypothetical protein [Alphaproteobacteria bacterium]
MASDNTKKNKPAKARAATGGAMEMPAGGAARASATHDAGAGSTTPAAAGGGRKTAPVTLEAALGRLRVAAYAAVALSLVGVGLASTAPIWSPKVYGNATSARFLALGVAQLRPVLESDGPFSAELATLRKIATGDNEVTRALEAITSESGTGVPTLPQLQARFNRTATAVLLSDVVDANRGWFDRMMLNVASTLELHVVLQKIKDKHLPSEELVLQAHMALAGGDLVRAVDAMERLSGRPAEVAAPWIKAARARIAANRVLQFLDTVAAARMSGGSVLR